MFNNVYNGKRILVTGHTGFKGGWLSLWLHSLGADVLGYSLAPSNTPNLFTVAGIQDKVPSIIADIRDKEALLKAFNQHKPEIVFHLAAQALVRPSYRDPVETYETNVMGTVYTLEACRLTPSVRAVVNVTSDKCYENTGKSSGYQENDKMGGWDPYSSSKGCSELVMQSYLNSYFNPSDYARHGVALASGRAGNVIGGGDWAVDRLIPDCIVALTENKEIMIRYPDAVRPWQYVLEPLYGYLLLAQYLYEGGGHYTGGWNFGPDAKNSKPVRWIAEKMVALWGGNSSWAIDEGAHLAEAPFLTLDCAKAKAHLHWQSQYDLEATLKNTINWYKAFGDNRNMLDYTLEQIHSYERNLNSLA